MPEGNFMKVKRMGSEIQILIMLKYQERDLMHKCLRILSWIGLPLELDFNSEQID